MNEIAYVLTVPLDRKGTKTATFHLKELTEDVYVAARSLMDKDKDFDAVRFIIKNLRVEGDDPEVLRDNFVAVRSAQRYVAEIIAPVDGELKKN